MATIEDTPLWVDGTLTAGNIRAGRVYVDPNNRTPIASGDIPYATVPVPGLSGTGSLFVQVTGHSDNPACRTNDSGLRQVSIQNVTENSFQVYVSRTNHTTNGTWVFYLVTRNP